MIGLRLLGVAATSRHVAYAFFQGGELVDWRISDRASDSPENLATALRGWIEALAPQVVVTERADVALRKGNRARVMIRTAGEVATGAGCLHVAVARPHDFRNKYDEATFLATRYPDLAPWLPQKRAFYENEPRNTIVFEAVVLVDTVLRDPATNLSAALG